MKKAVLALSVATLLVCGVREVSAGAKSAGDFLTDAMKGDNSEIKLGTLAQSRGGSAGIKNFGQVLVQDHRKAKIAVSNAASAMGITPTDDPTPEALAEATKLNRMSGAEFDAEFARYMVADHQKDIAEFEAEAKSGHKTNELAAQQLPILRKHLRLARSLEANNNSKRQ